MKEDSGFPELLPFGGPLQKLGARLGLAKGGSGNFRLGLAIGLPVWVVLVVLALLHGLGLRILSLAVVGVHVRLLAVIPLFFACESFVAPRMAEFVRNIRSSGVVPEDEWPALASEVRRTGRWANSRLAEAFFLLLALAGPLFDSLIGLPGGTGSWTSLLAQSGGKVTWVNGWYLFVCLPLFRFLLFRWVWRLGLWWHFLRRVSKLKLRLIPTNSDGAGGLGYLEVVQEHFAPLALAVSAVLSASFAEGISMGTMPFEGLYRTIPLTFLLAAGLFIGPLFIFTRKLWDCRSTGLDEYMAMAARYVRAFDLKWIRDEQASGESQLGTSDMQSLADLTNSVNVVRNMRVIPGGRRLVAELAACVVLPMLPLLLLKFPIDEVAKVLFRSLVGL
jgi:hypothetical protein